MESHQLKFNRLQQSIVWKIALPLRVIYKLPDKKLPTGHSLSYAYKRVKEVYKQSGYYGVFCKAKIFFPVIDSVINKVFFFNKFIKKKNNHIYNYSQYNVKNVSELNLFDKIVKYQFLKNDLESQSKCILIVAEFTLPQCFKYRVQQKQKYFEALGWQCIIIDWRDQIEVLSALQICKEVIFYRVPGFPNVMDQVAEAKRLGLSPWWEVDDLIFDEELYQQCSFMDMLPKEEKDLLLFGSGLFRKTMLACDKGIASTTALAYYMRQAGLNEVHVIENALDKDTLRIATDYYPSKQEGEINIQDHDKKEIIILYGSGTNTHSADFLMAADGILAALQKEPSLRFWIVGELDLPLNFRVVQKQIKYIPPKSYEQYMALLARADIAIAPLEAIAFNDAKSNIKFLEAAVLGISSVCSPGQAFKEFINDGQNGFLAANKVEWEEKILLLARDPSLRKKVGEEAYKNVLDYYKPEVIMEKQVKPVFGEFKEVKDNKLKILVVNIYYDPYSFGGATVVAEEMVQRMQEKDNIEITIFTSRPFHDGYRGLRRYQSHGSMVYSIDIPPLFSQTQQFNNVEMIEPFEMVLKTVKPDIVHFHSIQNFGLHLLYSCQKENIPYLVTLHDAWWLCSRQFMVKKDFKYCFQKEIDLTVCQYCEPQISYLKERMVMMKEGLKEATLLLSPGENHRQLYINNGIDKDKIKVNRNGIKRPKKAREKRSSDLPLRFGFVAGDEVTKGFLLIYDAFVALQRSDWKLIIVDSKIHMGHAPINVASWNVKGEVVTVPPYDDNSKDAFFDNIDVLLVPSQWKESYGMAVREALLRDIWVICTHPGGQSEDVEDGVNGTHIPLSGGAEELKQAVEDLLDQTASFVTYVNPHKDHIMTLEQQADELLDYYYQIRAEQNKKHLVS